MGGKGAGARVEWLVRLDVGGRGRIQAGEMYLQGGVSSAAGRKEGERRLVCLDVNGDMSTQAGQRCLTCGGWGWGAWMRGITGPSRQAKGVSPAAGEALTKQLALRPQARLDAHQIL